MSTESCVIAGLNGNYLKDRFVRFFVLFIYQGHNPLLLRDLTGKGGSDTYSAITAALFFCVDYLFTSDFMLLPQDLAYFYFVCRECRDLWRGLPVQNYDLIVRYIC